MFRHLVMFSSFCLAACTTGTGTGGPDSGPNAAACTVSLTGAVTQTASCVVVVVGDGTKTAFTVASTGLSFVAGIDLPADLLPQDYSPGDPYFSQLVFTGGVGVWNESFNHPDLPNFPNKGTFLLHFSSVGDKVVLGTGSGRQHAKGTLTGTLPADAKTGATGTVEVTVTFNDSQGIPGSGAGGGSGGTGGSTGTGGGSGGSGGGSAATGGGSSGDGGGTAATGGGSGNGGTGGGSGCTLALSGAVTASATCDVTLNNLNNTVFFTLQNPEPHDALAVAASFQISGATTTGTFTPAPPVTFASIFAITNGNSANAAEWEQRFQPSATDNKGTFTFTLTSVSPPHGTCTATLPPLSTNPSTTDVTFNATF